MGAVPDDGGVTFRVWAPNARHVAVIGDFCDWQTTRKQMLAPDNARSGTWSAFVPGAVPGTEYRFLIRRGGPYLWRMDPYGRQVTGSRGNSVVFDPASLDWGSDAYVSPGWDEIVLYELHVGTFAADARGAGTFDKAIGRLEHLAWLGVNAVEVMPPFEFAGTVSWGYNPSHVFAIESSYGGPHAFARFVREAHRLGIAVFLDVVHNHLGPTDLDLWRFDGWRKGGWGGVYFYNDRRALTPWGATRPDYGRSQVRRFLRDSAVMWLEDFRVDGLRFDGTNFIRSRWGDTRDPAAYLRGGHAYLAALTADLRERQPWKLLVAEDMQLDPVVTRSSAAGGLGFHAQWDAGFVHPVRAALETPRDEDRNLYAVAHAWLGHYLSAPHERVVFTESHDEVANGRSRLPETITPGAADSWHARKRSALGLALTLTAVGLPMLFQGQEFCEDQWFSDRRALSWEKGNHHHGFLLLVRDLVRLRRNVDRTTGGLHGPHAKILRVDPHHGVLVLHRWHRGGPGDDTIVVVNLSTRTHGHYPVGFPASGRWRLRVNTDAPTYGPDFGAVVTTDVDATNWWCDGYPAGSHVALGPYTALVFSQDPA
ncbi:alpha-amylase family glycosyl hydrolase [Propioniciclava sp.]|uniref:alpha-amylase family glycosyl hydrolase n=1 Tax=Propioniciclava sp. TaxID=2038686 RepID=UPI002616087F|nr:alpha-amylase family glycosyl hydrolase [Propioniciclava sp.]